MAYIPHTAEDRKAMLEAIGADSLDELFRDIPEELQCSTTPLDLPPHNEYEVERYFEERAGENRVFPAGRNFLGAGAYRHFIPAAVPYIASRGEFMTSYTPYQAEVSQGTLQAIFEFQSHICALTAMEVANASMYDGATALAEALVMALRDKRVPRVYLPELLPPEWTEVCRTFVRNIGVEVQTIPAKGARTDFSSITEDAAPGCALVVCTPNALGGVEDGRQARAAADRVKAHLIAVVNPTSLAVLAPPGQYGADIAVGEGQPLGVPVSFGGPYAGFLACRGRLIRKMPGRVAGETRDPEGRRGFVLTLQTREQHIRRDKATSNICTNQGLVALMISVYLTLLGREGLREVAETSLLRTRQLASALTADAGCELYDPATPHFHEVAIRLPVAAEAFRRRMKDEHGILPGFPLADWFPSLPDAQRLLLVNCTELISPADIDNYRHAATAVLEQEAAAGRTA